MHSPTQGYGFLATFGIDLSRGEEVVLRRRNGIADALVRSSGKKASVRRHVARLLEELLALGAIQSQCRRQLARTLELTVKALFSDRDLPKVNWLETVDGVLQQSSHPATSGVASQASSQDNADTGQQVTTTGAVDPHTNRCGSSRAGARRGRRRSRSRNPRLHTRPGDRSDTSPASHSQGHQSPAMSARQRPQAPSATLSTRTTTLTGWLSTGSCPREDNVVYVDTPTAEHASPPAATTVLQQSMDTNPISASGPGAPQHEAVTAVPGPRELLISLYTHVNPDKVADVGRMLAK